MRLNLVRTAEMLEDLRIELGIEYKKECPLIVSVGGGWRTMEYQRGVYERRRQAPILDSQHLLGKAADVACPDLTPKQVQRVVLRMQAEGRIGGVGVYLGFTHVDWGPKRSWNWENKQQVLVPQ